MNKNTMNICLIISGLLAGTVFVTGCASDATSDSDSVTVDGMDAGDSYIDDDQSGSGIECTIEGTGLDCSVAMLLTHSETDGTTARDKCEFICAHGFETGESGLAGTWCDAACDACISITGLDCESCGLLSDELTDAQCP